MKTKNKISGYIARSAVAGVLFFSMIVGITSAFNCSNGSATSSWRLVLPGSLELEKFAAGRIRRGGAPMQPRRLSFADRVAYQRSIEEVYWRHRIWPKERPDPKPSLDSVMSNTQLEKKVTDYLYGLAMK